MQIRALFRYPVKGLSGEALDDADLRPGEAIAWDRAFALAQGTAAFDPAHPRWLPKHNFMCLMKNARIARVHSRFDEATGRLTLRHEADELTADALSENGRVELGAWLTAFLGDEARGTPRFHYILGFVFGDQRRPVVSLLNLASLRALEASAGAPREAIRFRANLIFDEAPAWQEFDWVGRVLRVGDAVLRIVKRTERCPATEVNPATATRDADPPAELRAAFGHADLGVHAEVVSGGRIRPGDSLAVDPCRREEESASF